MPKKTLKSHCPINFFLELFGDRWSLLIIRDIVFRGKSTYGEFLRSEERFSTNILASRLEFLVQEDIVIKSPHPEDSRKDLYKLTEKGLDVIPAVFEMILWSAKYDSGSEAKRIMALVKKIQKNNRKISSEVIKMVRAGKAIIPNYNLI